jgi:hypothetical protein
MPEKEPEPNPDLTEKSRHRRTMEQKHQIRRRRRPEINRTNIPELRGGSNGSDLSEKGDFVRDGENGR